MKVRILAERGKPTGRPQAVVGDRECYGGETVVLEGRQAQVLLDGGSAEIVKDLPPSKKAEPEQPALSGQEAG